MRRSPFQKADIAATSDQAKTAAAWVTASLSAECPKAVAQQVKVPADEVRILGSKRNLLQALVAEVAEKSRARCPALFRNGAP